MTVTLYTFVWYIFVRDEFFVKKYFFKFEENVMIYY